MCLDLTFCVFGPSTLSSERIRVTLYVIRFPHPHPSLMSPHKPASLVFSAAIGYLLPLLCRNLLSVVALVSLSDRSKKLDETLKP